MRHLLFLMIMVLPLIGFGQPEEKPRRLSAVGIMVSPVYSYRTLNFAASNQWVAEMRNDEEVGNVGFAAGFRAHYRLRDKMKLEIGLSYANKSFKTKYEELSWTSDDPAFPTRSRTIYRYKYIMLPVNISYAFFVAEKVRCFASAGLSANVFLARKTKVELSYADGGDGSHASSKRIGYSRFNLSAIVSAGIDYRLSKRFTVRAEPFYERSLTSIVADDQAREYLFSFGVVTGVHYLL
jgi:hypothetical protein